MKGLLNSDDQINNLIEETDLIVNTTPVGMKKEPNSENNVLPYGENFWKEETSEKTLLTQRTQNQGLRKSQNRLLVVYQTHLCLLHVLMVEE